MAKSYKPKQPRKGLISTWLSFFLMTEDFLADEADQANTEDTLLSVLVFTISAVLIYIITGFFQFRQFLTLLTEQLALMDETMPVMDFNIGIIFFVILLGVLIMTPISFFLGAGIQFLGARVFGGSGSFKSHTYLLAIIQVPFTILGGVLSFLALIPGIRFVAGLVGLGLSIFNLILLVRASKAIHDLPTGRAVAGMIVPPLLLGFLVSCLTFIFGSAIVGSLLGMG